jgi:acetoacetyl-CoA synthetase
LEEFWSTFWRFAGVIGQRVGVATEYEQDAPMTRTKFFPDTLLNYTENMLAGEPSRVAIVEADEAGVQRSLTLGELRQQVARAQKGLADLGIGPGDRVAAVFSNDTDALVALLAATSLGAIWSSCAPEFGMAGFEDRFGQIAPKMLIGVSSYQHNGTVHSLLDKLTQLTHEIPSLEHFVVIDKEQNPQEEYRTKSSRPLIHDFEELCKNDATEPEFSHFPFNHPLYIVYTSGTTGLPKCITHSAGGVLLTHRKEHMLHCDIKPGDRVFYYSNTAWMMYHWHISALASGATLVLYDGAAIPKKDGGRQHGLLWNLAERAEVTHFGTSPKYLSILQNDSYEVGKNHDLSSLRMIMSAGAPLTYEQFNWTYREIKQDLCLASISGGTEILGCFALGNPTGAVHAGELQCPALGMALNVMDERNAPLVGKMGDLVCTEPFPSMPLGFWGEDGWQRYLDTYFGDRNEIWTHGDLAAVLPSGGLVISGRTDTLLKPGGVRIGTSEVYRVVEAMEEIEDSLVVGYPHEDDIELWLFVVTVEDRHLDDALASQIRERLRTAASPRHVPHQVYSVSELPYTLNGKKVEKAVLQVLTGQEVKNYGSLSNPRALENITEVVEGL